jgi:predicted DCC family thiol-disulfide oxidoreductase YuxK
MKSNVKYSVVLYDDSCNLCNFSKDFFIKRDKTGLIKFKPLSEADTSSMPEKIRMVDSILLMQEGQYHIKSTAVLKLLRFLPRWKILYFLIIVPKPIRDVFYDLIAKIRYRIWGRNASCDMRIKDENTP